MTSDAKNVSAGVVRSDGSEFCSGTCPSASERSELPSKVADWSMIGALGEIGGALAVVASLAYLGRQVRLTLTAAIP